MIKVHNLQIIEGIPFEEYLAINRISHSRLVSEEKPFKATAKTHLGSQVDAYLNEPYRFDGDIKLVKPCATALIDKMTIDFYLKLKKQVTILADLEFKGSILECKFRPDLCLHNLFLADIKVSENFNASYEHFKWKNQLNGYSIPLNVGRWMIISPNPKKIDKNTGLNVVTIKTEDKIDYTWWEHIIQRKGRFMKKTYY